jgi:hypothetical protein
MRQPSLARHSVLGAGRDAEHKAGTDLGGNPQVGQPHLAAGSLDPQALQRTTVDIDPPRVTTAELSSLENVPLRVLK